MSDMDQLPELPEQLKKKRRVFPWLFLALQVLFLVLVISGAASGHHTHVDCTGLTAEDCRSLKDARDAGTTLGVGFLVGIWAAVDIILGGSYLIYRVVKR